MHTCILCSEWSLDGLKYCAHHKAIADKQTLAEKLADQRRARGLPTTHELKFEVAINPKLSLPNTGGWKERHRAAITFLSGHERPMVSMLRGWYDYAIQHRVRYESPIGNDGVLGPEWEAIGDALRALLNGDCGRLDSGTVDAFLLNTMHDNGIDTEDK